MIDIGSIVRMLPHKQPAVLVDRILEVYPGETIIVEKNMSIGERAFDGHYPGLPIYPASFLIEVMFQACTLLIYASEGIDPSSQIATLNGVNKTKFRRNIIPGDQVEIQANVTRKRSNVWRFDVTGYVDDYVVTEGGLVISVLNRDDII